MNTQSATTSPNKDKFSKVYYQTKSIFQYLSQPNVGGFWEKTFDFQIFRGQSLKGAMQSKACFRQRARCPRIGDEPYGAPFPI